MLGNAVSILNPYFLYFNLELPYNSDIKLYKENTILLQYIRNEKFEEYKKKSRFGKMVKNTTTTDGEIKVDDCYICGGKFLDYGELQKIRAEFANDVLRKEATIDYLFGKVGTELHKIEAETVQRKANRNLAQKLFYSLMDM